MPPALKFQVLVKPNEWVKFAQRTINFEFYESFWNRFKDQLMQKSLEYDFENRTKRKLPFQKTPKLNEDHYYYMSYGLGLRDTKFYVVITPEKNTLSVSLELTGQDAKQRFDALTLVKASIEQTLGESLIWNRCEDRIKTEIILARSNFDFTTDEGICLAVDWLSTTFLRFYLSIMNHTRELNVPGHSETLV